jgi:NAD(P)-dependent dehydrogenase (short-subunit alcohol dehydrogenase family)
MSKQVRTVLVTAGASGIGWHTAKGFLAQGAQVHICDNSAAAIAEIAKEEPSITATLADAANVSEVNQVFEEIKDLYGGLDVLVNNVGISGPTAAMEDIEIEAWNQTINVNLNSFFYVTRLAIPLLKRSSGQIINMASNAGLYGCPLRSPYVAAKWAMIGLTKTLAMELGGHGIRVNAVCPGSVAGPRIDRVIENDAMSRGVSEAEIRAAYLTQSSMGDFINAEDIAQTILFLCSDSAKHISGQAIPIDGHTESLSTRP